MHLFCAGCKIFQETPSLLRWETARGSKRTAGNNPACPPLPFRNPNRFGSIGPPQHYEISSRHGSLGLPQHLEISSRLSGAFSRLQAHSFAFPRNAEESLAQAQLGVLTPPCSEAVRCRGPLGPSFFHKVGTLNTPTGLGTCGAPWRCFPHVCRPPEVRGAPHLRNPTRVWPPPLRGPPLPPAGGSWRSYRSNKRAGPFEAA